MIFNIQIREEKRERDQSVLSFLGKGNFVTLQEKEREENFVKKITGICNKKIDFSPLNTRIVL